MNHDPKSIINSVNHTISEVCKEYCDPIKNLDALCPIPCLSICQPICRLALSPPPPPPPPPYPYVHIDSQNSASKHQHVSLSSPSLFVTVSIASFAAALFLLLSCYAIYRWYNRRSRRRRSQPPQPQQQDEDLEEEGTHNDFLDGDQEPPVVDHPIWYIRTAGLRPSVICAITLVKYKRGGGLVDETDCAVCLNEFQEDEALRLLPKCNHAFHLPCIDTWLTSHTNCPLCRAGILINTAASLHSLELIVENPGPSLRETQVEIVESYGGFNLQIEDEARGLRNGTRVEEDETGADSRRGVSKTGEKRISNNQPMRRSVSTDVASASAISPVAASTSINQLEQFGGYSNSQPLKGEQLNIGADSKRVDVNQSVSRQVYCSVIGISAHKGPTPMERSHSCTGKVLSSSRYTRSRTKWDSSSSNS